MYHLIGWHPEPKIINAKGLKGEPVGEYYVTGNMADELVHEGLVTEEDLQPYKEYLAVEKLDRSMIYVVHWTLGRYAS